MEHKRSTPMKLFHFDIQYQTKDVVIVGIATVIGEYDDPPEELVRKILAEEDGFKLKIILSKTESLGE